MLFRKKSSKNFWFAVAILILTNLLVRGPDLFKFATCPKDKWFTGQASWFDPWDLNVYFSAIGWGKQDGIFFENVYDGQSGQKVYLHFFYTLLGKATSSLNLPTPFIFHLAGFLTSFFLGAVFWWFIKIFFEKEGQKKAAFALLLLGGGLGWLFLPVILPDLGVPGFTFANALRRPHEAVSLCLFLITLGSFWQAEVFQKKKALILGAISCFLMLFFHPYNLFSLGVIFTCSGLYWWKKKKKAAFLRPLLAMGIVAVVYFLLVGRFTLESPSFAGMGSHAKFSLTPSNLALRSPPPPLAILGWGLLSPLIWFAFRSKEKSNQLTFLKIWFLAHWTILYFPLGFQKLLIRGLWAPASLLAIKGLEEVYQKRGINYRLLAGSFLILASLSTFLMAAERTARPSSARWDYLPYEEKKIIDYLKTNGDRDEVVLASHQIANLIPAHTNKRVWAGHEFFTPQFQKRITNINHFFAGKMSEDEAKSFLEETKAAFIYWGPEEKTIGQTSTFPYPTLVKPVIEKESISLYRMKQ